MTPAQDAFAMAYVANGSNATQAYLTAHPDVTYNTATVEGSRSLGNPKVIARIDQLWKLAQMRGEEAIARIGRIAKFDLAELYDDAGALLPRSKWPKDAGQILETVDGKVRLPARLAALRTVAESHGKVKGLGASIDALADAMRSDQAQHGRFEARNGEFARG